MRNILRSRKVRKKHHCWFLRQQPEPKVDAGQQQCKNGSWLVSCPCAKATGNKFTKRTATEPSVTCAEHAATASSEPPDWLMLRASACHRTSGTGRSERQAARADVRCCGVRTSSQAKDARALQPAACTPAWRGCVCRAAMIALTAPAIRCANVCRKLASEVMH